MSSPAPFAHRRQWGVGEPSALLGLSSLMGIPSRFLARAGAAPLTTTNLQVFRHLHSLTLPYTSTVLGGPFPNPCPSNLMAWGARSLHLLASRDHLDLVAHPTNLPLPLQPHETDASCDDLYKINWIPIMVMRCPPRAADKELFPGPASSKSHRRAQEWRRRGLPNSPRADPGARDKQASCSCSANRISTILGKQHKARPRFHRDSRGRGTFLQSKWELPVLLEAPGKER